MAFLTVVPKQSALAQSFLVGVKGGVPLTSFFDGKEDGGPAEVGDYTYSDSTQRYIAGFSAEWRGPHGLGVESDFLYRRAHYLLRVVAGEQIVSVSQSATAVGSWDFPILAKYRFPLHGLQPFATGGAVFRHLAPGHNLGQTVTTFRNAPANPPPMTTTPIDIADPPEVEKRSYSGVAFGAGFETHVGRVHLIPEFRFTHWVSNIPDSASQGPRGLLKLTSPQMDFLLGIMF